MKIDCIDEGRAFDFGKTSRDYARYRDIYPAEYYQCMLDLGLCTAGQEVLDIGTGSGVIPRNMYRYGVKFTGTDISEEQIVQARLLAEEQHMDIEFRTCACRGTSASMSPDVLALWDKEHREMLAAEDERFEILHFVTYAELTNMKQA